MPPGDDNDDEDGRVLAPEELDISEDEHVAEIEDGRYVVSPNDPIGDVDGIKTTETEPEPATDESESDVDEASDQASPAPSNTPTDAASESREPWQDNASETGEMTEADVEAWLRDSFNAADSRYGFHITATFDGRVSQRRMMSNDVVTIFESLILWYAQHIDSETPVEEILGILLTESNVPISYPTESLSAAIKARGLGPDDSIGELMNAIGDDGFEL